MLETITLKNLQAHKNLQIKFGSAITCIIGSSDIGKSAVLRALRWLALNKGTTKTLRRRRTKVTKVRLTVDGKTITRIRGKSNKYVLDGKSYKAIGKDVPPPIAELLNVSEVNFQQQHDSPFWFSKSASQVSKELNQIVNLGLIDKVLMGASSRVRATRSKVEVCEQRLLAAKQTKQELAWVRDLEKDYRQLCLLEQEATKQRAANLEILLRKIDGAGLLIEESEKILSDLRECSKLADIARNKQKQALALDELLGSIDKQEYLLCQLRNQCEENARELKRQLKGKCPLCGKPILS
jgi:predicted ATP-dependent endonuclease of OLD family